MSQSTQTGAGSVDQAIGRALAGVAGPFFFVGSGKNAGKTTLLNRVNAVLHAQGVATGITTIGHDGEPLDAVLGTAKPPIEARPGNWICLTRRMFDDAAGVLDHPRPTGLETPVGTLVIGRCVAAGRVEILGPETNARCDRVCRQMTELGAEVALVDGAFSRRTQIALRDRSPLALIVSGDLGDTLDEVRRWVRYWVELFALERADTLSHPWPAEMGVHELDGTLVVRGPVLDEDALRLAESARGRSVILDDATKVFCDPPAWRRLREAAASIRVRRTFDLRLLASNPTARFKPAFEPAPFAETLADAAAGYGVPVVDVTDERVVTED